MSATLTPARDMKALVAFKGFKVGDACFTFRLEYEPTGKIKTARVDERRVTLLNSKYCLKDGECRIEAARVDRPHGYAFKPEDVFRTYAEARDRILFLMQENQNAVWQAMVDIKAHGCAKGGQ